MRAKQIRIYPNVIQRKVLEEWFKIIRHCYNSAVKFIHTNEKIPSSMSFRSLIRKQEQSIVDIMNNSIANLKVVKKFISENPKLKSENFYVPAHIVSDSIIDAYKAYKSSKVLMCSGKAKYKKYQPKCCYCKQKAIYLSDFRRYAPRRSKWPLGA